METQIPPRREYQKAYYQNPDVKAKYRAKYLERREKGGFRDKSHANGASWRARPATQAKLKEKRQLPESKKRHNELERKYWKIAKTESEDITSEKAKKQRIRNLKKKASGRHIAWDLKDEDAWKMLHEECTYCGKEAKAWTEQETNCATIDRIDSSGTYTNENTTSACLRCNLMKNVLKVEDFLEHIRRAARHIESGKCKLMKR